MSQHRAERDEDKEKSSSVRPAVPIRRTTDKYIMSLAWGVTLLGVVMVARLARANEMFLAVMAMLGTGLVGTCAIGMSVLLFEKWNR